MEHYPECQAPCCPWMPQPCDCQCTCADIAVIEQRALNKALEAINELISQSKRYGEYEGPS